MLVNLFFLVFGLLAMITFISWIAFARLSMARIEREMRADGLPRPCPWDGVGGRAIWYAWAIALPIGPWNRLNDPLIDVPRVRQYASRRDVILGRWLMGSGYTFVVIGVAGWFLDFY